MPPRPFSPTPSPPFPAWTKRSCFSSADGNRPRAARASPCRSIGERLGITDQFQGVDQIELRDDGSFEVLERVEGGKHQASMCAGAPAVLGWATGNLPEPRNNPQIGMANMRTLMPALQKAKPAALDGNGLHYVSVSLPKQQRSTRVVKDMAPDDIAAELADWISGELGERTRIAADAPICVRATADPSTASAVADSGRDDKSK